MKKLICALILALLLSSGIAEVSAIEVTGIDIINYGIYDIDMERGIEKDNYSLKLMQKTDKIPAKVGLKFGYEYVVNGLPKDEKVVLTSKVIYPRKIKKPNKLFSEKKKVSKIGHTIGDWQLEGYMFEHDYELVEGDWRFELWHGKNKLFEKIFHVYIP